MAPTFAGTHRPNVALTFPARTQLLLAALFAVLGFSTPRLSHAQCAPDWVAGPGARGISGLSYASTSWDPDGAGPRGPVLVVGGDIGVAENLGVNNIAAWDPATGAWSALGSGLNGIVYALATLPDGRLVAGGDFTAAGSVTVNHIAVWDGTTWSGLGVGVNQAVYSLFVMPSGDLVVGGRFSAAGGHIARWDGASWSGYPGSPLDVRAIAVLPNGDLVAGGSSGSSWSISRWHDNTWSQIGTAPNGTVTSLAVLPSGDLVVGGWFSNIGYGIARWNGTAWTNLGTGIGGSAASPIVFALLVLPSGDLVAGGSFSSAPPGNAAGNCIARWDGSTWTTYGSGCDGQIQSLTAIPSGDLFVSGRFGTAGGIAASSVAHWHNGGWSALSSTGTSSPVYALANLPNGDLVAGGEFIDGIGDLQSNHIARWNGASWSTLSTGTNDTIRSLASLTNGNLVAGGDFTIAGGQPASRIARWNGTAWLPLGTGVSFSNPAAVASVNAILPLQNNTLVAGGFFSLAGGTAANNIALWNGSSWSALGQGLNGPVLALAVDQNSRIIAGGGTDGFGQGGLYRWNGATWSALGAGITNGRQVSCLAIAPNGDVIAGGYFWRMGGVSVNGIARWNGTAWASIGPVNDSFDFYKGTVDSIAIRPNGDIVVGGYFSTVGHYTPAKNVALWNGTAWSALSGGVDGGVSALANTSNGDLVAGGNFGTAGGVVSAFFARYTTHGTPLQITVQPQPLAVCRTSPAAFSVVASGSGRQSYQWRKDTIAIDSALNPSAATANLVVSHVHAANAGRYDCVVSNACGSVTSNQATLSECDSDFNCDGAADLFDYLDFVSAFADSNSAADFNDDGVVDFFDYLDFVAAFAAGC